MGTAQRHLAHIRGRDYPAFTPAASRKMALRMAVPFRVGNRGVRRVSGLRIELLGGFRVTIAAQSVPDAAWHRRKPAAVLKLLALTPSHRLHRGALMETLWPELTPEAAGANLRKAL